MGTLEKLHQLEMIRKAGAWHNEKSLMSEALVTSPNTFLNLKPHHIDVCINYGNKKLVELGKEPILLSPEHDAGRCEDLWEDNPDPHIAVLKTEWATVTENAIIEQEQPSLVSTDTIHVDDGYLQYDTASNYFVSNDISGSFGEAITSKAEAIHENEYIETDVISHNTVDYTDAKASISIDIPEAFKHYVSGSFKERVEAAISGIKERFSHENSDSEETDLRGDY